MKLNTVQVILLFQYSKYYMKAFINHWRFIHEGDDETTTLRKYFGSARKRAGTMRNVELQYRKKDTFSQKKYKVAEMR